MIPVELMVPATSARLPTGAGYAYEPKWDGYRAAVAVLGDVQIMSRRGTDLTGVFPDLATVLADQVPDGTFLDAEIVVLQDGRLSFDALQHRMAGRAKQAARLAAAQPASLVVFDVMLDRAEDVRGLSWEQRRRRLESLTAAWQPPLQITPYTTDVATATEWMESLAPMGIEGIVSKRLSSRYGARGAWSKSKFRETIEGVIGATVGPLSRPDALIVGRRTADGDLVVLGRTTALTSSQSIEIGGLLRPPSGPHPWPDTLGAGHFGDPVEITHAEPTIIVEVSADAAEQAGRRRHPLRFMRIRHDG
jgi:ATP-dependent DNA ligase